VSSVVAPAACSPLAEVYRILVAAARRAAEDAAAGDQADAPRPEREG
jgi:hypothetical protein